MKYNEGSYKESVALYGSVPLEKLSAEESFYLGLSLNNLRDVYKASQYFRKSVELAPGHLGYRIQHARTLSQLGRTNEAVQNYKEVIEKDSSNVTALFDLGLIYYDTREFQRAALLFDQLVSLNNNDFLSGYYLGSSMLLSANPNYAEPALKHLEHSIAVNQEYLPAINLLALSKFNLQKYYEANALYGMAIKLRPQNADYLFKSGMCYERLKFFAESSILYNRAIALDSNQADYFDHLGFAYFNLGKYDSAAAAYNGAVRIDQDPVYYINLGFTYARMDSLKRSIESFQNALSRMPIDKIGNIYNQIGAVHYSKKSYKEAKSAYEMALIYYPGNIDAQFYIAMINEKLMDWKNALSAYRKVIKLAKGDSSQTERIEYSNKKIDVLKKIR
jgi:tetratricopeptide (TPR) repeat protein